jgi:predicted Ser/Thr protein kinase
MLTDAEILILKLAFERQLIDASLLSQCVTIYKASNGTRRLGEILCTEGQVNSAQAARIGKLALKARQSRGSIIVSRRQMEDELLKKMLEHKKALDAGTIERAQLEQQNLERSGRFSSLGEVLTAKNVISQLVMRKTLKEGLDRLATCVGCYRHFVTPGLLPQKEYPCRHCGQTIFVGELTARAYQAMAATTTKRSSGMVPLASSSSVIRNRAPTAQPPASPYPAQPPASPYPAQPPASPYPAQPPASPYPAQPPASPYPAQRAPSSDTSDPQVFMTGRFQALSIPVKQAEPIVHESYEGEDGADQEMTVALSQLKTSGKAKAAPKGARFGDFEVLEELARGGFGVVYKALKGEKIVALKVLIGGKEAPKQAVLRFNKEAELSKKLRHPGIVGLVASGKILDFPFMALEFVEGDTIEQRIKSGAMDPKISAKFLKSVAEAVHHAHRAGVIHRDLKPANVILSDDTGIPKIIDFGVAKNVEEDMGFTQSGTTVGTPYYMSPEQVRGDGNLIGLKTDIYSLGVILYEMLTGTVPFRGENLMDLYHNIATEEIVLPSQHQSRIPEDLETICLVAMAKEIEDRYESANHLAKDLGRFLSGRPIEASRPGTSLLANPIFLIAAAVVLAGGIIALVSFLK